MIMAILNKTNKPVLRLAPFQGDRRNKSYKGTSRTAIACGDLRVIAEPSGEIDTFAGWS